MALKFFQQVKHSQRTEKYIRLTFNSYISEDDFFWRFARPVGVPILHQCTLCNLNDGNCK
jgi:hypothetical protein